MRAILIVSGVLLLVGSVANADPLPNMVPSHDVTGTYLVDSANGQQTMNVEYSAELQVIRVTPPSGQGYILYDFGAHDAKMVMPQMQKYMDQPSLAAKVQAMQSGGGGASEPGTSSAPPQVTTLGTKTIAGYSCMITQITDRSTGHWSKLCVTSDGVTLEVTASDGDHMVAQNVSYATVPVAEVQVPAGYTEFVMPAMPGGMSMPGGMAMPGMPPTPQ